MRSALACIVLAFGLAVAQDLFEAAELGAPEDIVAALAAGESVHQVDEAGNTPLLLAVAHNTADVVATLLDAGADAAYANPKTGMGIFGLVWRNPNQAQVRALFDERGLVPHVGPRETEDAAVQPPQQPAEAITPLPPLVEDPPELVPGRHLERLDTADAEARGFVFDPEEATQREDIRDWVTNRFGLGEDLTAATYVLGCRTAVLELIRAPETALFDDAGDVRINPDGVMEFEMLVVSSGAAGARLRSIVTCTGFVERDMLHLWIDIVVR